MSVRRKRKFGNKVCRFRLSGKQTLKMEQKERFGGMGDRGWDGMPVHLSVKGENFVKESG